jgi:purine nucleosidase
VFDAFSGLPPEQHPIIAGLNITERIELHPHHVAELGRVAGSEPDEVISPDDPEGTLSTASNPVVRYLSDAVRFYMEFHLSHDQGHLAHIHDPFAAALAIHPEFATLRPATVDVELGGTLSRGQTIADWAGLWGREHNAAIAVDTDPAAFFAHFIERVGGLARRVAESA